MYSGRKRARPQDVDVMPADDREPEIVQQLVDKVIAPSQPKRRRLNTLGALELPDIPTVSAVQIQLETSDQEVGDNPSSRRGVFELFSDDSYQLTGL